MENLLILEMVSKHSSGCNFSDALDVLPLKIEFLAVYVAPFLFSHIAVGLRTGQVES